EPGTLGEAVLFTRWQSDCLGWVPPGLGREASEGVRPGFSGDNGLGHRAHPNKAFRANDALKRKGLLGLVLRGWAARSAVTRDDDHVPDHAAAPRAGLTRRQARMPGEAYLTRRVTRRRRVLLWPPRPDASSSSIDGQWSAWPETAYTGAPRNAV